MPPMSQLTTLVRSLRRLGNAGAVANVQSVLDARRREDWIVTALAARLADDGSLAPSGQPREASAPAA